MSTIYGYMRVSSLDQNVERQRIELLNQQIQPNNIYCDKQSGKNFNRPAYQKLKAQLRPGDVLIVKSIDRLGRNYEQILAEWSAISKQYQADIVILDMPLLDTRSQHDLMGTLISDIVLQLLSYVAQVERENIKQRQAEGIALAKAKGIKFGRPKLPIPAAFYPVYEKWQNHEYSIYDAARQLNISVGQFRTMRRKMMQQLQGKP